MSRRDQLPKGFVYGDEVPDSHFKPRPETTRRRRKITADDEKVECLKDALLLFTHSTQCRKTMDLKLDGMRIGALFIHPSGQKYAVRFAREPYYKFGDHFPHVPEKGWGIICNMKLVGWGVQEDIRIATIFPDARCYWLEAKDFWQYYQDYETEVSHAPGEISCPMDMWKRLF